jgi:hypothetical protein
MTEKTIHEGRNVKRIREILGIKQDALAMHLVMTGTKRKFLCLKQKTKLNRAFWMRLPRH